MQTFKTFFHTQNLLALRFFQEPSSSLA